MAWAPITHCTCADDNDWCEYCALTDMLIGRYQDARAEL